MIWLWGIRMLSECHNPQVLQLELQADILCQKTAVCAQINQVSFKGAGSVMQLCPPDIKSSGPIQMATLTRHFTQRCKPKLQSASSSAGTGHKINMWAKASEMVRGTWPVPISQHHCPREWRLLLVTAHDEAQVAELALELWTPEHSEQIILLTFYVDKIEFSH